MPMDCPAQYEDTHSVTRTWTCPSHKHMWSRGDTAATLFRGYFSRNAVWSIRGAGPFPGFLFWQQVIHAQFKLIAGSKNLVCPAIRRRAAEKILFSLRLSVMNEKPFGNLLIKDLMTEECLTRRAALLSNRKMTCSFVPNADYADFIASCSFLVESSAISSPWNISREKHQDITPHPLCRQRVKGKCRLPIQVRKAGATNCSCLKTSDSGCYTF